MKVFCSILLLIIIISINTNADEPDLSTIISILEKIEKGPEEPDSMIFNPPISQDTIVLVDKDLRYNGLKTFIKDSSGDLDMIVFRKIGSYDTSYDTSLVNIISNDSGVGYEIMELNSTDTSMNPFSRWHKTDNYVEKLYKTRIGYSLFINDIYNINDVYSGGEFKFSLAAPRPTFLSNNTDFSIYYSDEKVDSIRFTNDYYSNKSLNGIQTTKATWQVECRVIYKYSTELDCDSLNIQYRQVDSLDNSLPWNTLCNIIRLTKNKDMEETIYYGITDSIYQIKKYRNGYYGYLRELIQLNPRRQSVIEEWERDIDSKLVKYNKTIYDTVNYDVPFVNRHETTSFYSYDINGNLIEVATINKEDGKTYDYKEITSTFNWFNDPVNVDYLANKENSFIDIQICRHSANSIKLNFNTLIKEESKLSVFDIRGRLIYNCKIPSNSKTVSIPGIHSGFGVIQIESLGKNYKFKFMNLK